MDSFLRDEFLADCLADGIGEPCPMTRYHALRKDRNPKNFERKTRPEQHSNRQPRTGVTVKRRKRDQKADLNIEVLEDGFDGVD